MDELEQQIEETKLQLEETKLQLSDKLGTLEHQVSQTVETASSAVAATVEAVQGTVESVTGAVDDAVHSMHDAFDLRHQIEKHPFLVLGGAVVVGYLAAEYFKTPARDARSQSAAADFANSERFRYDNRQPQSYAAPQQIPQSAPRTPPGPSPLESLKTLAISTLLGSMQGIAMRAIPEIVGLVMGNLMGQQAQQHGEPPAQQSPRPRVWPEETPPFASPPTDQHRSSKLS